jgi:predicted O-methyltransferase YrrM
LLKERIRTAAIALRNVLLGSNAASTVLAHRPAELVSYATHAMFLLDAIRRNRGLPERNVLEVLPDAPPAVPITLTGRQEGVWFGPISPFLADLVALCILCRATRPRTVFEIGTLNGYSALHLALNSPDDATVYTLDLPTGAPRPSLKVTLSDVAHADRGAATTRYWFSGTEAEPRIRTLHGDSATFDFSPWHGKVDLFFIDGAHSYEYVRSDTENALRCVRPGGAIAWHDFGRRGVNGVGRYLRELAAQGRRIYVVPGGSLAYAVGI